MIRGKPVIEVHSSTQAVGPPCEEGGSLLSIEGGQGTLNGQLKLKSEPKSACAANRLTARRFACL